MEVSLVCLYMQTRTQPYSQYMITNHLRIPLSPERAAEASQWPHRGSRGCR